MRKGIEVLVVACIGGVATAHGEESGGRPPPIREATVLADRMLWRELPDVHLDPAERCAMSVLVEGVMWRIRERHRSLDKVTAQRLHTPGVLLARLTQGWAEALIEAAEAADGADIETGIAALDEANGRLGLRGVRVLSSETLVLEFDRTINVGRAAAVYEALEGVEWAERDGVVGDGPNVEMGQYRGAWYVVFREAWGDCPSGCIDQRLWFVTVRGERVRLVPQPRAVEMDGFSPLLQAAGWRVR